jgi:lactate permease
VYTQDFNPVSDSLALTSIFATLPLITLFVLLGGVKMKGHLADAAGGRQQLGRACSGR